MQSKAHRIRRRRGDGPDLLVESDMAAVEMRLAALVEAQPIRLAVKRETSGRDAVRIAPGDRPDIGALIEIGFERIETGDHRSPPSIHLNREIAKGGTIADDACSKAIAPDRDLIDRSSVRQPAKEPLYHSCRPIPTGGRRAAG